jgi:hypothetical protein
MSPLSRDEDARGRQLANLRPAPAPPAGNVRALQHGAHARRATVIAAGSWAERIYAELASEAPLRDSAGELPAHDRQLVELLASALARLQAVQSWLDTRPAVDEKGRPWPAEEAAVRLRREIAGHLDALGMSPRSRARLGLDLQRTVDLSTAMSDPDPVVRRALLTHLGMLDEGAGDE